MPLFFPSPSRQPKGGQRYWTVPRDWLWLFLSVHSQSCLAVGRLGAASTTRAAPSSVQGLGVPGLPYAGPPETPPSLLTLRTIPSGSHSWLLCSSITPGGFGGPDGVPGWGPGQPCARPATSPPYSCTAASHPFWCLSVMTRRGWPSCPASCCASDMAPGGGPGEVWGTHSEWPSDGG